MAEYIEREYTLVREANVEDEKITQILASSEEVLTAYALVRDKAYFTDRRIILTDVQGVGKKKEFLSVPYSSIEYWAIESAGLADFSAELDIYLRKLKIKFNIRRDVDINELSRVIAEAIL